jgi:catechol 2,3-dioxygenase-like lactoylglutathione lyase family enzyme
MTSLPITEQITFLYTRDLATTAYFYEEIMRLPLVVDQGSCRIYRITDDAYLGFCERDEAPEQPQGILFTLVTPDVDGWADHLRVHEVPFDKAPAVNPDYNIYHCFVRDPNGYVIEIQRFLDENWNEPV